MQDEVKVSQALPPEVQLIVDEVTAKFRQELQQIMAKDEYTCLITGKAIEPWARQFLARHRHQAERETLARMGWRPIDDCPMWELAIVTDGENVAKAQKAECDYGGFYWSIEPEDALEWEPTLWMPFALPPAPEAA